MKLYQTYVSPFPTRVRLSLYAKGIPFEAVEPPGFGSSTLGKGDYLQVNPIGRVPALVLDDGRALPESEVICEYLEETYPTPPMLPAEPWPRAQVRLLSRISDVYLVMAMVPLFDQVARKPADRDVAAIQAALAEVSTALGYLDHYIGAGGYAVGDRLTLADGALAPMLILADEWVAGSFGAATPLPRWARLSAYWRAVQRDVHVARICAETREAIAVRRRERAQAQGQ